MKRNSYLKAGFNSIRLLMATIILCLASPMLSAALDSEANGSVSTILDEKSAQGREAIQRGDFERAATLWQEVSGLHAAKQHFDRQVDALIQLAEAYQALGQLQNALQTLEVARRQAQQIGDHARMASWQSG
jgi:thioredoxin-like negative regulator of GroEL